MNVQFFVSIKYAHDILQLGTPCECPIDNIFNSVS